ncbi:hypothetical protein N7462_001275 [Penicillium macrosclerotiorum]|uniref:uncharacterized protein n=1 Tax=Penicillium macrosclerotiorum TaxID=303699 RepID=UPI0025493E8B|nr:uncharacterized protein N7462_001275 [Penicillium macrosclerotiorum]KAJ5691852.1 hypothetical protein N7462_001275 [Penicillium macrosclerotiorum]
MRLSLRVGSATALILFTFFLLNRRLSPVGQQPNSFWHFDTTSFRASLRPPPPPDHGRRKWGIGTGSKAILNYQTTPIEVPNEGIIVMGRVRDEDTAWVSAELAEWRNFIYTVDDTSAPVHTPKNKGREALPYLQFIVDHYNDLPPIIVFLHSHRDGWPAAWHTDTMDYSNVDSVRALQRDFVQAEGFPGNTGEKHYADAWKELFGNTDVPQSIGAPCCSQFAVSRDQVLQRPLSDYQRMYNWVLTNDLPDEVTSSIMEYSWHIIFGKDPIFCPDTFQCYADVYGEEVII